MNTHHETLAHNELLSRCCGVVELLRPYLEQLTPELHQSYQQLCQCVQQAQALTSNTGMKQTHLQQLRERLVKLILNRICTAQLNPCCQQQINQSLLGVYQTLSVFHTLPTSEQTSVLKSTFSALNTDECIRTSCEALKLRGLFHDLHTQSDLLEEEVCAQRGDHHSYCHRDGDIHQRLLNSYQQLQKTIPSQETYSHANEKIKGAISALQRFYE